MRRASLLFYAAGTLRVPADSVTAGAPGKARRSRGSWGDPRLSRTVRREHASRAHAASVRPALRPLRVP